MRRSLIVFVLLFTTSAFAKDVFFPIAGSTTANGTFRTDVRLFNPSTTKSITVQLFLLPVGNKDNSSVQAVTRTIGSRQMMILNDVVTTLGGTDLDAIRLTSADDFIATERVYAVGSNACASGTTGQDVPAIDPSSAKKAGVLLNLKTTAGFRTNIGLVNPTTSAVTVTFKLYDKNNALVSTGSTITIPPMGVIAPTNMTSGFFFSPGSADLSDAWASYSASGNVIAYASVVDNATLDPTFIAMAEDTGGGSTPTPTAKTFSVTVHQFAIEFSPAPTGSDAMSPGDTVTLTIKNTDGGGKSPHGLEVDDPDGVQMFNISGIAPGQTLTRTITVTKQGTYNYYCTQSNCGQSDQHGQMFGQFIVGQPSDTTRPGY